MGKSLPHLRSPKLNRATSASDFSSRQNYTSAIEADNASFNSESIGQMSVTPTVASLDTVKISNRVQCSMEGGDPNNNSQKEKKTPWKKLKQFIGIPQSNTKKTDCDDNDTVCENKSLSDAIVENGALPITGRAHSKSVDFTGGLTTTTIAANGNVGRRRRISSMDTPKNNNSSKKQQANSLEREQAMIDDAVRGRLDGMDILYLGPAYLISLERHANSESSSTPWEPANTYSFAGRSTQYTTRQIVSDMMERSVGGDSPEIIMEGFFRDDRWLVTLDLPKKGNPTASSSDQVLLDVDNDSCHDAVPSMQLTDEEDHSHSTAPDEIPRHKLWGSMWGSDKKPPPKPSHMTSMDDFDPNSDSILEMAASCSVPVDVDEDSFMIGNAQHLQAVHELASVPLQHGQFQEAMEIFDRILRGLEAQENDALRHLEGVTLHNMAVISMWQDNYEQALEYSGKAVKARLQYLPEGHPDIAVSLVRQGYAYFALERFDMAEASFHAALDKIAEKNVIKAKVLSNLGVAQYQRRRRSSSEKLYGCAGNTTVVARGTGTTRHNSLWRGRHAEQYGENTHQAWRLRFGSVGL
jgi:Tetratricopeptide repeat